MKTLNPAVARVLRHRTVVDQLQTVLTSRTIALRAFAGIDLAVENAPDATTLLKFRRLLIAHELTRKLFDEIGISLCERGLMMKEGTLVDATIIEAPPSTKNAQKSRDPEMHQRRSGSPLKCWFATERNVS